MSKRNAMNVNQSQNLVSSCGFSREMNINIDVKWQMWPAARLCCVLESPYITAQWDFIQFSSMDDNMKNDATVADIADNTDTHLSWLPSCSLHTITPGLWHQHWWNTQLPLSMPKMSTSVRKVSDMWHSLVYQSLCSTNFNVYWWTQYMGNLLEDSIWQC